MAELLGWRPEHGVISLYIDPHAAERGGRWRIELRDGLKAVLAASAGADREARLAVEATVRRIEEDLLAAEPEETQGRALAGFLAAAHERGEERWYEIRIPPRRTEAALGPLARVGPLLALLDDGAPRGIVALSAERVRLLHWYLGRSEQLHDWELEVFALDWRERKAPRSRDPASGQMVSAAGRDQYNQRLESSRERFAHQTGELTQPHVARHGWRQLLLFGDERYARHFADGFAERCEFVHVEGTDLVSQPTHLIEERVEGLLPDLNRARERALIERIKEAAFTQARAAFGPQETLQALNEGRVEHLVYDAEVDGGEGVERMIELAVGSGAEITPVEGNAAALLEEQAGVAALLRY